MSGTFPAPHAFNGSKDGQPPLSSRLRLTQAALGCALLTILVVAAWLTPDQSGRGTHQQLGLPPCTFVLLFDQPCPSCGMTTAWAHTVRGQITSALESNVGGTLLAAIAIVVAPWSLISALRGRWWIGCPGERVVLGVASLLIVVTIVDWLARIW